MNNGKVRIKLRWQRGGQSGRGTMGKDKSLKPLEKTQKPTVVENLYVCIKRVKMEFSHIRVINTTK